MKHTKLISTLFTILLLASCSNFETIELTQVQYQGSGDVVEYHANGQIRTKAVYLDGELVSRVAFYASGTKEAQESYQNNQLHQATYYFTSGEVKGKVTPDEPTKE